MLYLYRVTFYFRSANRPLQPVLVSAARKIEAERRAREFIKSNYDDPIVHEDTYLVCRTPDDVLEWN